MDSHIVFALIAMVGFGITALMYKLASRSLDAVSVAFFTLVVNVFVVMTIWLFWPNKEISLSGLKFAVIAGVVAGISSVAYILSIKLGNLSVTTTIRGLFFGVTVILAVVFLRESITMAKVAGVLLSIISIFLLSI